MKETIDDFFAAVAGAKRENVKIGDSTLQIFGSANPLLRTSNPMTPESYILHDALEGWINGETDAQVRIRGAAAYAKYQKISQKSAQNLLVTG